MKVAVAGKGGSGKTTVAAVLARSLARAGRRVLAIDADPNPCLAVSLGIPPEEAAKIEALPGNLLVERIDPEGKRAVGLAMSPHEIGEKLGVEAPDGVRLVVMGGVDHAGTGCNCLAHATVRGILENVPGDDALMTVTDMEAGLEHLKRGTPRHADVMLMVVEPYYKSLETAVRVAALASELAIPSVYAVANKIRGADDEIVIKEVCDRQGLKLIGSVPYDEVVVEAQRSGAAPMDIDGNSPAVRCIAQIAGRLESGE